jgi:hypothetical protein
VTILRRIPLRTADEQDVLTGWRRRYVWTQRAGACAEVKRRYRRRERHESATELRRESRRTGDDDR